MARREEEFDPAHEKIWQENSLLCQNFDELKRLYLQSTQINLQLQATCSTLQQEKENLQKAFREQSRKYLKLPEAGDNASVSGLDVKVHQADDYISMCAGTDGVPDLEAEKQKPADEKGCSRSSIHSKDAVIFDLEQAIQQLENHLRSSERSRSSEKKEMEMELKRLQECITQKEKFHVETLDLNATEAVVKARREEERHWEVRKSLANEVSDLRALLTAVEQASAEAELRYLHAMGDLIKEKELLQADMMNMEKRCRTTEESLAQAGVQIDDLRMKLNVTVNQRHEAQLQATSYKSLGDELERKIQSLKEEIETTAKLRENDRRNHGFELETQQKSFDSRQRRQEDASREKCNSLQHKIKRLQKKLKQCHKQIARLTVDCSELLVHRRECETQLAILENAKLARRPHQTPVVPESSLLSSKVKSISSELSQISSRQAKYLRNNANG